MEPPIIGSYAPKQVSVVTLKQTGEELGTGLDVVVGVETVATRGTGTLVLGDLHEALLPSTTNSLGVAGALLEGEGCEQDRRHCKAVSITARVGDMGDSTDPRTRSRIGRRRR